MSQYLDSVNSPWGRLFYDLIWAQLPDFSGEALDFGSGFGLTAAHIGERAPVTAVEPDEQMRALRFAGDYRQLCGGAELLPKMRGRFGLVLCHNVLEYVPKRADVFRALADCLRPGGALSIVKHNPVGKVLQAAAFTGDPAEALRLYRGGCATSASLGREIGQYEDEELLALAPRCGLLHERTLAARSLFALGPNEHKRAPNWRQDMLALEQAVQCDPRFVRIAFFHHLIFTKE